MTHGEGVAAVRTFGFIAVGLWPTLTFAQTGTQVVQYYHTDALGSVRAVTKVVNGQTQVVSRHDYRPFGEELAPQTPPVDKRLFTGKERDQETGWDYFGARYYRWDWGRFTSPDLPGADQHPTDSQSWGLYVYVRNNPLRWVDPGSRTAAAVLPSGDDADPSPDPDVKFATPELEKQAEAFARRSPIFAAELQAAKDDHSLEVDVEAPRA